MILTVTYLVGFILAFVSLWPTIKESSCHENASDKVSIAVIVFFLSLLWPILLVIMTIVFIYDLCVLPRGPGVGGGR